MRQFKAAQTNLIHRLSHLHARFHALSGPPSQEHKTLQKQIQAISTKLQTNTQLVEDSTKSLRAKIERMQCTNSSQHKNVMNYERRIQHQQNEMVKKRDNMLSAEHLSKQVQELYFRQRKIMWIYVILLLVLLGGIGYLFYASVKSWRSAGQDSGLPDESIKNIDTEALGEDIRTNVESMKNSVVSMFTPKAEGQPQDAAAESEADMLSSSRVAEADEDEDED